MIDDQGREVATSYDRVALEYARRISNELEQKPLDRQLLDQFAEKVAGLGPVCDLGCGPGHVARYLHNRGVEVIGVDLSSAMVSQARRLNPSIEFRRGDMRALEVADHAWAGIVAFYSLIHIPPRELSAVFREFRRVLRPGGLLLIAFHLGNEVLHLDEWWGEPVSVDFFFFRAEAIRGLLGAAGFKLRAAVEREPYPGVEHPSRRGYLLSETAESETGSGMTLD